MVERDRTQQPYTKEDLIFGVATQPAGEEDSQPASAAVSGEQEGAEKAEEVTSKQWKSGTQKRSGGIWQQDLKLSLNRFKHRNTDVYLNFFKGALLDFD